MRRDSRFMKKNKWNIKVKADQYNLTSYPVMLTCWEIILPTGNLTWHFPNKDPTRRQSYGCSIITFQRST